MMWWLHAGCWDCDGDEVQDHTHDDREDDNSNDDDASDDDGDDWDSHSSTDGDTKEGNVRKKIKIWKVALLAPPKALNIWKMTQGWRMGPAKGTDLWHCFVNGTSWPSRRKQMMEGKALMMDFKAGSKNDSPVFGVNVGGVTYY